MVYRILLNLIASIVSAAVTMSWLNMRGWMVEQKILDMDAPPQLKFLFGLRDIHPDAVLIFFVACSIAPSVACMIVDVFRNESTTLKASNLHLWISQIILAMGLFLHVLMAGFTGEPAWFRPPENGWLVGDAIVASWCTWLGVEIVIARRRGKSFWAAP